MLYRNHKISIVNVYSVKTWNIYLKCICNKRCRDGVSETPQVRFSLLYFILFVTKQLCISSTFRHQILRYTHSRKYTKMCTKNNPVYTCYKPIKLFFKKFRHYQVIAIVRKIGTARRSEFLEQLITPTNLLFCRWLASKSRTPANKVLR